MLAFPMLAHVVFSSAWRVITIAKLRHTIFGMRNSRGHAQSLSLTDGSGGRVLSRPLPNNMGFFLSRICPGMITIYSNLSLHTGDASVFQYAGNVQVLVSGQTDDFRSLTSRMEASLA